MVYLIPKMLHLLLSEKLGILDPGSEGRSGFGEYSKIKFCNLEIKKKKIARVCGL
jgi:hypothetical protein